MTTNTLRVMVLTVLCAVIPQALNGADSVQSGKGTKYHARSTNNMTMCWRPANTQNTTNAVDCKQCLWAIKATVKANGGAK